MAEKDRIIEQIQKLQEQRKILTTYLAGVVGGLIALLLSVCVRSKAYRLPRRRCASGGGYP